MPSNRFSRRQFLTRVTGQPQISTAPEYTPNEHFYRQQAFGIPALNVSQWCISIGAASSLTGMARSPMILDYQDMLALTSVERGGVIACAGGGILIGGALWRGVALRDLLDEVAIQPQARYAHFFAADGYVTSLALEQLDDALLAYTMNGETLPQEHGFPARLIVPGLSGYKMPKWIQRIEFADTPLVGFWESRGWSQAGTAPITAAILSPRHHEDISDEITFSGIAFAGTRAVMAVELSIDGGDWMPLPASNLLTPETPSMWTRWQITWTPPNPGEYSVSVRASNDLAAQSNPHSITIRSV
ncbi:MAG: molybdopterin-dependent oxidoreductase [Burkholderiales bacterium]|nr:molybdopterin-dependent oxidoreductase [Anaerolineae bacterium]